MAIQGSGPSSIHLSADIVVAYFGCFRKPSNSGSCSIRSRSSNPLAMARSSASRAPRLSWVPARDLASEYHASAFLGRASTAISHACAAFAILLCGEQRAALLHGADKNSQQHSPRHATVRTVVGALGVALQLVNRGTPRIVVVTRQLRLQLRVTQRRLFLLRRLRGRRFRLQALRQKVEGFAGECFGEPIVPTCELGESLRDAPPAEFAAHRVDFVVVKVVHARGCVDAERDLLSGSEKPKPAPQAITPAMRPLPAQASASRAPPEKPAA